jgi:hypothetical protein
MTSPSPELAARIEQDIVTMPPAQARFPIKADVAIVMTNRS